MDSATGCRMRFHGLKVCGLRSRFTLELLKRQAMRVRMLTSLFDRGQRGCDAGLAGIKSHGEAHSTASGLEPETVDVAPAHTEYESFRSSRCGARRYACRHTGGVAY